MGNHVLHTTTLLALLPILTLQGISASSAATLHDQDSNSFSPEHSSPEYPQLSSQNNSTARIVTPTRLTPPERITPIQLPNRSVSRITPSSQTASIEAVHLPNIAAPETIASSQSTRPALNQSTPDPQASKAEPEFPNPVATRQPDSPDQLSQPTQAAAPEPAAEPGQDKNALFEHVFGRPRNAASQQIVVPFWIEDERQGQLFVLTATDQSPIVRLQAAPLLEKLKDRVRIDVAQQLSAAVDGDGYIPLNALKQVGLEASFDERRLEIRIQIPPTVRKTAVNTLGGQPPEVANALRPSGVSGYLNVWGAEDVVWSSADGDQGRRPLHLSVDGALNIHDWVLESSANFLEGSDSGSDSTNSTWSRGDIRLVHDDPAHAVRYTLGEQSIPTRGYQSSIPMLGVSMVRNFSLQPYQVTRPISRFEFFLERPSSVEVFINNRSTKTLSLPAGTQDIRDLPLNSGVNDVELVITDDLGRVQRLNFPAAVAADQLAPGIQQFAYGLGVPSSAENGSRSYDWSHPTLSLAHRWGVNENLTLGGYLQANSDRQLLGVEGIWSTGLGNFGWNAAVSHDSEFGIDGAARLDYELLQVGNNASSQRSLRVGVEYRGPNFAPLGVLTADNPYSLDISANYSQQILGDINANLNGRYQIGRDGTPNTYGASLGLSQSFNNGMSVNLNLGYQHTQDGEDEARATLNLFWLLSQRQSVLATADVNSNGESSAQVALNFNSARSVDSLNGSISVTSDAEQRQLTGQLNYTGYRVNLGFAQDFTFSADHMALVGSASHFTFGTALVFADGHFCWSRPVTNSFALVVRRGNLQGRVVGVNPSSNDEYAARADRFGPAVLPDLQPYYLSPVRIEVPNLPAGYDIGPDRQMLLPSYHSGTVVYVGTDATVFLRGTLLDENAEPVALQSGKVYSLSDPEFEPVTLFTNQAGRFAAPGFKPGNYELRLNDQRTGQFEIPDGKEGVYNLGTLQVQSP